MSQCFEELGEPEVNFDTFWDVYSELRDLVEIAIPDSVVGTLGRSIEADIVGESEADVACESEVDEIVEDGDDEVEIPLVDFTNEEGLDELY